MDNNAGNRIIRYSGDLGCKWRGIPHDLLIVHDSRRVKVEACTICNRKYRWYKGPRGRVQNTEYLKAHVRNFAQRFGATKRIYKKIYQPEECKIRI